MLWIAVTADRLELPYAVAESAKELAEMLKIKKDKIYKMKNASGTIMGYRVVTVDREDSVMKYRILERFYEYLKETMNKNTARKYYSSVKGILKEAAFESLEEVEPDYICQKMQKLNTKNDFSAAKRGLLKLQEFDPSLQLPEKEFFSEHSKMKRNYVKSRGQEIYKDTIMRKINKVKDPNLRLAYRLAAVSGLRVSEIANLRSEDIDLTSDSMKIYVRCGKGGKSGYVTCLNDEYVKEGLAQLIKRKEPDSTLFYGTGHLMNEASRLDFECHDLRRIFAQDMELLLIQEGKTKQEAGEAVRVALRHSHIKTTKLYLKGRKVIRSQK